jgi:hypothetical protein
MNWVGFWVG